MRTDMTGADMKRVLLLGRNVDKFLPLMQERGLEVVSESPDVILTYGGDGLLLRSEAAWPGIPKLPLRNSRHGKKCQPHEVPEALDLLVAGRLVPTTQIKVCAEFGDRVKIGLNDVAVHNRRRTSAVRYLVSIDDVEFGWRPGRTRE